MYEFLGQSFNSLNEIYFFGLFSGLIFSFIEDIVFSLINYIRERSLYWHDKRKGLKRERENRKNC